MIHDVKLHIVQIDRKCEQGSHRLTMAIGNGATTIAGSPPQDTVIPTGMGLVTGVGKIGPKQGNLARPHPDGQISSRVNHTTTGIQRCTGQFIVEFGIHVKCFISTVTWPLPR
ncbi:hypothetical protein D3C80_1873800 [compost metagenome]